MLDRFARQVVFFAPAAVMSAWAVVMLHTLASGHLNRYLSPMFHQYVMAAGIVLLVLSILHLLLYQPEPQSTPMLSRLRQIGRWLVLLIPVVASAVLSPTALSNTTMQNREGGLTYGSIPMPSLSSASQANVDAARDADPNQPAPLEVTDLITIGTSPAQTKAFTDRKVRVIGLYENDGGTPKLVRWIMWCCAADAKPVSAVLAGKLPGNWQNDQWIEVTGSAEFPATLGHAVPTIQVDGIKAAQEPDDPYLSP